MNGTMDVSIDLWSVSKFSTQCTYLYWERSLNSETLIKKRFYRSPACVMAVKSASRAVITQDLTVLSLGILMKCPLQV